LFAVTRIEGPLGEGDVLGGALHERREALQHGAVELE